ncbi:MAG: nodulation protein NfeD [Deltaproteobacteria bacterium]|nr:nodulation protein NfeD [Deltaproteobacteria bacterium]
MNFKKNFILLTLLFLCLPAIGTAGTDEIVIIPASGAISPGMAGFIERGIENASNEGASCVIIAMDTPGGLAESMRRIVMAIYASRIPVVVYVSPAGARAASAGVMITMAADIAAMAPGTNIGAAHPVGAGGKEIDGTMSKKITNDMVAHIKSIAEKRGRNVEWAEKAVRESVSITETEALQQNVIDIIARDMDDLIRQLNGRKVNDKGVLELENVSRKIVRENLRTKILKTISDPNIAYILMMIGLAGLYFELSHPGAVFPGVVGGIAIVLAFFAFQTLPVNYAGILLILLAIIFFIMEMKITSFGLLSVAGVTSLVLGSVMLFEETGSGVSLSWHVLVTTVTLVSLFFISVAGLVFRAQISRPRTGAEGLIGEIGIVKNDLNPEGRIQVHGELWKAVSRQVLPEGVRVRVIRVEGLLVEVEPVADNG